MTKNSNVSTLVDVSKHKKREKNTGYLICYDCILGSVGFLTYLAGELGLDGYAPTDRVQIYRSADELFNAESMETLENKAFTIGHPEDEVTISNDADLRKGLIRNVHRDGDTLKGDIIVTDVEAIKAMRKIHCLSLGYRFDLEQETDGSYAMKNIVYNHIALVEKGRSNVARVQDSASEINNLWKGGNELMGLFKKKVTAHDEATDVQDACITQDEEPKADETTAKVDDSCEQTVVDETTETAKADDSCESKDAEPEKQPESEPEKDEPKVQDSEPVAEEKIDENKGEQVMDEQTQVQVQTGLGNDEGMFTPKAKDAVPSGKTFEQTERERSDYYKNTLNPHKNKDYRNECVSLVDILY